MKYITKLKVSILGESKAVHAFCGLPGGGNCENFDRDARVIFWV